MLADLGTCRQTGGIVNRHQQQRGWGSCGNALLIVPLARTSANMSPAFLSDDDGARLTACCKAADAATAASLGTTGLAAAGLEREVLTVSIGASAGMSKMACNTMLVLAMMRRKEAAAGFHPNWDRTS